MACSPTPPLAAAFLALGDDDAAAPDQHSLPRAVTALIAALVLALAGPLAWATAVHKPSDEPPATLSSKSGLADEDGG